MTQFRENSTIQGHDWFSRSRNQTEADVEPLQDGELDNLENKSPNQLEQLATRFLMDARRDGRLDYKDDGLLFPTTWGHRRRREVFNEHGVPIIQKGLEDSAVKRKNPGQTPSYNRSHPEGRKLNKNRSDGFYIR